MQFFKKKVRYLKKKFFLSVLNPAHFSVSHCHHGSRTEFILSCNPANSKIIARYHIWCCSSGLWVENKMATRSLSNLALSQPPSSMSTCGPNMWNNCQTSFTSLISFAFYPCKDLAECATSPNVFTFPNAWESLQAAVATTCPAAPLKRSQR